MTRDRLFEEARDAFGFDVSPFLGNGLSPEVAEHVEESFAAALSHAAGEPVEVSGARLDGTKIHVNARMSRELAEKLGLVPSIPTFLEFFEALRAARPLLAASAVELTEDRLHILCPASATFDAAEALRLELVAAAPPGVAVDVEVAAGGADRHQVRALRDDGLRPGAAPGRLVELDRPAGEPEQGFHRRQVVAAGVRPPRRLPVAVGRHRVRVEPVHRFRAEPCHQPGQVGARHARCATTHKRV